MFSLWIIVQAIENKCGSKAHGSIPDAPGRKSVFFPSVWFRNHLFFHLKVNKQWKEKPNVKKWLKILTDKLLKRGNRRKLSGRDKSHSRESPDEDDDTIEKDIDIGRNEIYAKSTSKKISQFKISIYCKFLVVKFWNTILSNAFIKSATIYLLLLEQTVESNPGPPTRSDFSILTYNCNGLGDRRKLKRLLIKLDTMIAKGCIVCLQETHIVNTEYLKIAWKHKFVSNCVKTNSAGVIILFSNKYNIDYEFLDSSGRLIIVAISSDDQKIVIANSYFPNDHKIAVDFAEVLYDKILSIQNEFFRILHFFGWRYEHVP